MQKNGTVSAQLNKSVNGTTTGNLNFVLNNPSAAYIWSNPLTKVLTRNSPNKNIQWQFGRPLTSSTTGTGTGTRAGSGTGTGTAPTRPPGAATTARPSAPATTRPPAAAGLLAAPQGFSSIDPMGSSGLGSPDVSFVANGADTTRLTSSYVVPAARRYASG